MTKTGSLSRTVSDREHNNISFQRKEDRLLEPNQQKFVPNKEQAPRAKRSRTHPLILGFKQKPGSQSRKVLDRIPQTIFPERKPPPGDERSQTADTNKNISFQTKKKEKDQLKWNTCTNNKRRQRKNENYALGTRGTLNMLNKVVAKLARKPNNPNIGEKTRNALHNG